MPIVEYPLYGKIQLETTASTGAFSWVDQTASLQRLSYSEGSQPSFVGESAVNVGTLTAQLFDAATVPSVGDYVRLRRQGTTEYWFTGYVQDVNQRIYFDPSKSSTTPAVITTLVCLDWVGLLAQFQINGINGKTAAGADETVTYFGISYPAQNYLSDKRVNAINYGIDSTMATLMVSHSGSSTYKVGTTDAELTASAHLDLLANSVGGYWYGKHTLPTNNSTGRDDLIQFVASGTSSSGKTFTDAAGSAGDLHYTEIELTSSSTFITNSLNVSNRASFFVYNSDYINIGGSSVPSKVPTYGTVMLYGIMFDENYQVKDATSIATYNERGSGIETNIGLIPATHNGADDFNLVSNPNVEYDDNGWGTSTSGVVKVRRRQPNLDATAWSPVDGLWAMRARVTTAGASATITFQGSENDGTPVTAGNRYRFDASAARGTLPANAQARATIRWLDDDENLVSQIDGSWVNLTNIRTWYGVTVEGAAPANSTRANIRVEFRRSDATNFATGQELWVDAYCMYRQTSAGNSMTYFTGDTENTDSFIHKWTGDIGNSSSVRLSNTLKTRGDDILAANNATTIRARRIRWNAQEDLTAVASLTVGKTIALVYKTVSTTYRIIGIDATMDEERYMIDYYLWKV